MEDVYKRQVQRSHDVLPHQVIDGQCGHEEPVSYTHLDVYKRQPLAASLAEADDLIAIADKGKRILQPGHLERFNPAVLAIQPQLRRPMFFEAHRLSIFTPRSLDVDVVLDLMIHDLDIVLTFANSAVREVRAVGLPILDVYKRQIKPRVQQSSSHRMVMNRGNRDRGRIQLEIGGKQFIHRCKDRNRILRRGFGGARSIRLNGCRQRNPLAGGFQFAVDTEVIAAKGACPGNSDTQNGFAGYAPAPLPSTACKHRP